MNPALGHLQSSPPTGGIWHSLNRLLAILILVTLAFIAAYRFLPEMSKRRELEARIAQLKLDVEKERMLLVRNTRQEELLKHDAEYVGLIARDRLDLMKEGETIYRLEQPKPDKGRMRLNR